MLAIRLQRTGRKGHAMFRLVVQDSRRTPSSGNIVKQIGSLDPHTKALILDKEKAAFYINNGAQPSERVASLLHKEGVKLPKWVSTAEMKKQKAVRNPDKLRRNRPPEAKPIEKNVEEPKDSEDKVNEAPVEEVPETNDKQPDAPLVSVDEPAVEPPAEDKE